MFKEIIRDFAAWPAYVLGFILVGCAVKWIWEYVSAIAQAVFERIQKRKSRK